MDEYYNDAHCCAKFGNLVIISVVNVAISLVFCVCMVSLIVWIMFQTNAVSVQIHNAHLSRFELDLGNHNLHYDLSLNFSILNSNKLIGIHYDKFETIVYYRDQRVASVFVTPFYQGHKDTTVVKTMFQGQNLVLVGKDLNKVENDRKFDKDFEDDRKIGVYGIDVTVRTRSRGMLWPLMTLPMKPSIRCNLKVPLLGSSNFFSGGSKFNSTKCTVK